MKNGCSVIDRATSFTNLRHTAAIVGDYEGAPADKSAATGEAHTHVLSAPSRCRVLQKHVQENEYGVDLKVRGDKIVTAQSGEQLLAMHTEHRS